MVRDHVLHELRIVRRVARIGNLDRLFGAEFARGVAWCARLNDGHFLGRGYSQVAKNNYAQAGAH